MADSQVEVGEYRALGLISNPFVPVVDSSDSIGVRLAIRSASLRLLSALDTAVVDPDHRPIVAEKSASIPSYYDVAALSELFGALGSGEPVADVLSGYVPVDMMRLGRVRAALSVVAEKVSGAPIESLLALWSRRALIEPSVDLPEWSALQSAGVDVAVLVAAIDADGAGFSARVFGEPVEAREGAEDTEALMKVATARQRRLETDPEEDPDVPVAPQDEEAPEDPMAEAFVTPLGDADHALPEGADENRLVADYVIAYLRSVLSPVIARGVAAYRAQGMSSMAQELKITKAPSKTLAALLRFASVSFRATVLLYDRFEMWDAAPSDLRMKIIATLTQQRWSLKDDGVLVLFVNAGEALELRESFASATVVPWDFTEVDRVFADGVVFDREAAERWLASASIAETPAWAEALFDVIPADTKIESACTALAEAIDIAARSGSTPDPGNVSETLARMEDVATA